MEIDPSALGWLPNGSDATPSVSALCFLPVLNLAALLLIRRSNRKALAYRDALRRYDAQTPVVASVDKVKPRDSVFSATSAVRVAEIALWASGSTALGVFVLATDKSVDGLLRALAEFGPQVAFGVLCSIVPPLSKLGRKKSLNARRLHRAADPAGRFAGGTIACQVLEPGMTVPWLDSPAAQKALVFSKALVFGIVSAHTGMLLPLIFAAWLWSLGKPSTPSARSLRTAMLWTPATYLLCVGAVIGAVMCIIRAHPRQDLLKVLRNASRRGEFTQYKWAPGCANDLTRLENCAIITTTLAPLQSQWPTVLGKVIGYGTLVGTSYLPVLQSIRNFDLLAVDAEEAVRTSVPDAQAPSTLSADELDRNGKRAEIFKPVRTPKLPTYDAAVGLLTAICCSHLAVALGLAAGVWPSAPGWMYPVKIEDFLFSSSIRYRAAAVEEVLGPLFVTSVLGTLLIVVAASASALWNGGWANLTKLWTARYTLWQHGPPVGIENGTAASGKIA